MYSDNLEKPINKQTNNPQNQHASVICIEAFAKYEKSSKNRKPAFLLRKRVLLINGCFDGMKNFEILHLFLANIV